MPGRAAAVGLGLAAVALTLGVAELVAAGGQAVGLFGPAAAPLSALGAGFIDLTPGWLKDLAVSWFGVHDKTALRVGMGVVLVLAAAVIGLIGRRSPRIAAAVAAGLLVVAAVAVLTRADAAAFDLAPLIVGGTAGLWLLLSAWRRTALPPDVLAAARRRSADDGPVWSDDPDGSTAAGPPAGPGPRDRGGRVVLTGDRHPMGPVAGAGGGTGVDRRQFLRLAGSGAVVAVLAGAVSRLIPSGADVAASRAAFGLPVAGDLLPVPGTPLDVPGLASFITPNADFYRIDTAFTVPRMTTADWRLNVHGLVDSPFELTFDELVVMPSVERTITLTCVSNEVGGDLIGTARWQGVRIADVLARAGVRTADGPQGGPDCVLSTSVDGFTVTTPLQALTDGRDALLAYGMNGEPLPQEHGFPVRMVVPGLYGYVSATKWVVDLAVTRFERVSAFWSDRGWAEEGPIKLSSRIDVPRPLEPVPAGEVTIAGVAWAQHIGVAAVQVQIDGGDWQDAELSDAGTADTWRQWVYRWVDAPAGEHWLRCRATDAAGTVQTADVAPPAPDGSTGLDAVKLIVSP
ncbi:molybdopterin-dependent oxidoreductase [Nakamurella leprariae]|nr:molybdopterin-dependent oxidoreductase [Nakamurella leprariae]